MRLVLHPSFHVFVLFYYLLNQTSGCSFDNFRLLDDPLLGMLWMEWDISLLRPYSF